MIEHELFFEKSIHTADSIQRAIYRLSDRMSCDLKSDGDAFVCLVHVPDAEKDRLEETVDAFRKEVVDQALRERIREETEVVRNLILALAFSQTGLTEESEN